MAVGSPEVTVVIPTRNRWPLAERAVRSALGQLNVEVEVLVVDDASDTRSPTSLAADQLAVVRLLRPSGVSAARNAGIERSTARWVSFLDDDDLWAPQRLRRMVDEAKKRDAEFVYSSALMVDPELNPLMLDPAPLPQWLPNLLRTGNAIPGGGSGAVVSAASIRRSGGFDESFSYLADWELWWRLSQDNRCAAVPEPLMAYVVQDGSGLERHGCAVFDDVRRLTRKHSDIAVDRRAYERHLGDLLYLGGRRWSAARKYVSAMAPAHALRALLGHRTAMRLRLQRPPPAPPWLRCQSPFA